MRKIVVAVLMFAAVILSGSTRAHAQAPDTAAMEREFVALVNDLRASRGFAPLGIHEQLVLKARSWSGTMANEGDIRHSHLPDGITASWRRLGENVGRGGSVRALHDAFVASPSHYKNLVDPTFTHLGVGVVDDGQGTIFVSEEFMELQPAPAPAPPPAPAPAEEPAPPADSQPLPTEPSPAPAGSAVAGRERARSAETGEPSTPSGNASEAETTELFFADRQESAAGPLADAPVAYGHRVALVALGALLGAAGGLRMVAAQRVVRILRARATA